MKNIYAGYRFVTLFLLVALITNSIVPTALALTDNSNSAIDSITSNQEIQNFKNSKKFAKVIYNNSSIENNFSSSIESNFNDDWEALKSINTKIDKEYKKRALSVDAVAETDNANNLDGDIMTKEPAYMMTL